MLVKQNVFISYSHVDKGALERIQVHLKPLRMQGKIDLWDDTRIKAGGKWEEEIEKALDKAAIAILLISADFLASDFITENELPPLLKSAENKGTVILPVILTPCRFTRDEKLSQFEAINDPKKPVSTLPGPAREVVYQEVCERVEEILSQSN